MSTSLLYHGWGLRGYLRISRMSLKKAPVFRGIRPMVTLRQFL